MISILLPAHNEQYIMEFMEQVEQDICPNQIITFNDRYSQGKGYALRLALTQAKGDYVIFIDGDGDIKPYEINKLIPYLNEYDVVVGKKQLSGSFLRKCITIASRLYIGFMFGLGVDTQTGIKAFNYKPEWKTDGFGFDIEILARAKREGKKIIEVPVTAHISGKMGIKDIWKTLLESLGIWLALLSPSKDTKI